MPSPDCPGAQPDRAARACDCIAGRTDLSCCCPPGQGGARKQICALANAQELPVHALAARQLVWDGRTPARADALEALRVLLAYIGEDIARPGLQDTPERVLKAWEQDWGSGYRSLPPLLKLFPEDGIDYDQMVVERGLVFQSMCEHHMAPFFGTVDIAYIPDKQRGVLGLSKFARIINHYARRLQVQERLTAQIADHLAREVSPHVAVRVQAVHFCMVSRGVRQPNAQTATAAIRGDFNDTATRAEFYRLIGA